MSSHGQFDACSRAERKITILSSALIVSSLMVIVLTVVWAGSELKADRLESELRTLRAIHPTEGAP